jgi:biopolymer transport protein ExbB/TolQ
MSEMLRSLFGFFAAGGGTVMVTVVLLSVVLFVLVIERLSFLGARPWDWVVPALRRRRAWERTQFLEQIYSARPCLGHLDEGSPTIGAGGARRLSSAEEGEGAARRPVRGRSSSPARSIDTYASAPSRAHAKALLALCHLDPDPIRFFLRRVLERTEQAPPATILLEVEAARLQSVREVRRRLYHLPVLIHTVLLLGLAGALIGLHEAFTGAERFGSSAGTAWETAFGKALVSSRTAIAAALAGVLGAAWVWSRARSILVEIEAAAARLRRAQDRFAPPGEHA